MVPSVVIGDFVFGEYFRYTFRRSGERALDSVTSGGEPRSGYPIGVRRLGAGWLYQHHCRTMNGRIFCWE
jgi:hypothetical protein